MTRFLRAALIAMVMTSAVRAAKPIVLTAPMHHLRVGQSPEWSDFPNEPEADRLEYRFAVDEDSLPRTLRLRQQDVKQTWRVLLNERELGRLRVDENDMVVYFDLPADLSWQAENLLQVQQAGDTPDDVRIGQLVLDSRPIDELLAETRVEVEVADEATGDLLPARITIVNADGALQTVGIAPADHLAARPGVVYTSTGQAGFGLPAGRYTIFAGRGFEYSLAESTIEIPAGQTARRALKIRREVPTEGYVACDTHVHTLTYSGHGDASIRERMVTIAGEGIELPVATDHNSHVDYEPFAAEAGVRGYFTPVMGNEVTTRTGHFNVFPIAPQAPVPGHRSDDWRVTLDRIFATPNVRVAILNHARDLHGGTRPFGPRLYNAAVGENLDGWFMGFNAMEVINSGATQTDVLQLFRDWMTQLNRGRQVTPVGSSDSHDVARHFVGQGRTYIRCDDYHPDQIDIDRAVQNFLAGQVMVSYGLLADIRIDDKYRSGEVAAIMANKVKVDVRVLGPGWVSADRVLLFANGQLVEERAVSGERPRMGVVAELHWELPKPAHDVHLVAIALGPGIDGLYWPTAKAYQPTSPIWQAHVIGCSGAVWLDVDGDGRATSARAYAEKLVAENASDLSALMQTLGSYDAAVAAQAAHLLETSGTAVISAEVQAAVQAARPATQEGFAHYLHAWRECQAARATP